MKKLFILVLPFLNVILHAENLKFVTVLSSPVGTFNRLETVDSETPVKSPVINFCTKLGNSGTVKLQGAANPEVSTLNLSNATTLGGNGADYVLNKLTMKPGGTLKGSRLLANVVQVPNAGSMGVSENLYSNSLTVTGAKTRELNVNNGESKIDTPHSAADMVWSNEYQEDKACGADCQKQYLLKEKGTAPAGCPAGQYESNGICCPEGQISKDGKKCVYAYKPERVKVGILVACHSSSFEDLGATGVSSLVVDNNTCRRPGSVPLSYFIGGKLPDVAAGGDGNCTAHHSYYNGGKWWEGGEHQGYGLGRCNTSVSDQEFCDSRCTGSSCTAKCIIEETYPDTCGRYKCSNGRHCDNAAGSGTMLRCVRA